MQIAMTTAEAGYFPRHSSVLRRVQEERVVGLFFGLPSLRIKGFYLAASTLGAQFFFEWLFTSFRWFSNNSLTLTISAPRLQLFGIDRLLADAERGQKRHSHPLSQAHGTHQAVQPPSTTRLEPVT